MFNELKKQLNDYEVETITNQNFEQVFEVYDTNQDFFLLVQGEKVTIESSISDIKALPPDCGINQKNYISIWRNGKIVGALDLIEGYPDKKSIWIGLLLIHGNLQGKKIGSKLVDSILNAAKTVGYQYAQLGVVMKNTRGLNFWQKLGFKIFRYDENVSVMVKDLV